MNEGRPGGRSRLVRSSCGPVRLNLAGRAETGFRCNLNGGLL
jgi:hypothetical protein